MPKKDYNFEYETSVGSLTDRPRLLLHTCCAPCLAAAIVSVTAHFDVTLYYYNPNIYPLTEYEKRLSEIKKLVSALGADAKIVAEPYDRTDYDKAVGEYKGGKEHGGKCERCLSDRLERTAKKAAADGYDYFSTTLTSSSLKSAEFLNETMRALSAAYGVKFLPCDFKKKNGALRSKELCEKFGIYRQRYCGCTPPRVTVAVTGGIASGKSTFTRMLGELGAYTIDADKVTRELQAEGSDVNALIKREFPNAVVVGRLDRAKLKAEVFSDPSKLKALESIVHPAVGKELALRIARADAEIVVVEVPLLFECNLSGIADITVNVASSDESRRLRAKQRDGITDEMFDAVAAAQMSGDERRRLADVTVENDGDAESLRLQAKELMTRCVAMLK